MNKNPKQSPENILKFNALFRSYWDATEYSDAEFAEKAGLSKTTISRMVHNRDHRGGYYCPSEATLVAVCLALNLTPEQRWELYYLIFPEREIYKNAMDNGNSVAKTNITLEEKGCTPISDQWLE